jgi:hypothetical protein
MAQGVEHLLCKYNALCPEFKLWSRKKKRKKIFRAEDMAQAV